MIKLTLDMQKGNKNNQFKTQIQRPKKNDDKNSKGGQNTSTSNVLDLFKNQQMTQNIQNESFKSTSFDSAKDGTMIDAMLELPQMVSVLEARRIALDERKSEALKIKDNEIKNVLMGIIEDIKNVVEDNDKILRCHNELINRQNDDSEEIQMNCASINNLTKGVGNLVDGINAVKSRVQSLEITKNCAFDSQFMNMVFVDAKEADDIESGNIGPKEKIGEILSEMKIVLPKEIIDTNLMTVRRYSNGKRKQIKMLRVRFSDSVTAGRIFAQVIKHNKKLADTGKRDTVKYYAEISASKNVWNLKRICYELKNEGTLVNVRGSDRGILVSYKMKERDENKEIIKTCTVTSEKEIDDLRKLLKVEDAYISVVAKYNEEFWNQKKRSGITQKRGRENDENDLAINPKRTSTPSQ